MAVTNLLRIFSHGFVRIVFYATEIINITLSKVNNQHCVMINEKNSD